MTITVNGHVIDEGDIARETQHHPADSFEIAREEAARALVVRELLLDEARRLGIEADPRSLGDGKRESEEDSLIRRLLEQEIHTPDADIESCRRYYENNKRKFRSPELYEAAHIFLPAPPKDENARNAAEAEAKALIAELLAAPDRFAELARARSRCTSAREGGSLGQIARGQTVPEFETFLDALEEGQICPVPVPTRYGFHVVRLDRREPGKQLPFEAMQERIAAYLRDQVWNRAVAQYIRILAGRADIEGFEMEGARTPLVQ